MTRNVSVPAWALASTAVASAAAGFILSQHFGRGAPTTSSSSRKGAHVGVGDDEDDDADDDDEDEEEDEDEDEDENEEGHSKAIKDSYGVLDSPFKLLLCVNMSLQMGKGKIAAQCGHATLGAYRVASQHCASAIRWWQRTGQAKIAVKVDNDELMRELAAKARAAGLVTYIVEDAGRTQIAAGSKTVLAIGPAPVRDIDKITSHLKLL